MGIVIGDLSVSYGESQLANEGIGGSTVVERQLDSVQFYTMGAMTISGALSETSNAGGTGTYEEREFQLLSHSN